MQNKIAIVSCIFCILGAIGTFIGAYFGYLAYRTAYRIFRDGIQIDHQKVLDHICLELATSIQVPFEQILNYTSLIYKNDVKKQSVTTVRDTLDHFQFYVSVPYYDSHKGDLFDALSLIGSGKEEAWTEYVAIEAYIESAKKLSRGISKVRGSMDKYIEDKKRSGDIQIHDLTLGDYNDYLSQKRTQDEASFDSAKSHVDDVSKFFNQLKIKKQIMDDKEQMQRNRI